MQNETRAILLVPGVSDTRLEVWAWSHAVTSTPDEASGLPTGKRQHAPLVVTRPIDRASPRLLAALVSGDVIKNVVLEVWHPTTSSQRRGPEVGDLFQDLESGRSEEALEEYRRRLRRSERRERVAFVIRLLNASVSGIETEMDDGEDMEHVSFAYERMIWIWDPDGEQIAVESGWGG